MIEYPIPVRHYVGDQALTIACQKCHATRVITVDEIYNEDIYECPADTERGRTASTEPRCGGSACMKFSEADECPGCGSLGFYGGSDDPLKGACSRRCMLQAEYAEALKRSAA